MIRTLGYTKVNELIFDFPLSEIRSGKLEWYWVGFYCPMAIEDYLEGLQRPKLNYYHDLDY